MKLLLLIAYSYFLPNKYDPGNTYEIPPQYVALAYYHASGYDDVDVEEMLGILLVEHGSAGRWISSDSIGDKGRSFGLYQIRYRELKEYNLAHETHIKTQCVKDDKGEKKDPTCQDLMNWRVNSRVAAWIIHRHKAQHARKGYCNYCRGKSNYCAAIVQKKSDGTTKTTFRKPVHTWVSHWKCGPKEREFRKGCEGRRVRVIHQLSLWKEGFAYHLIDTLEPTPEKYAVEDEVSLDHD